MGDADILRKAMEDTEAAYMRQFNATKQAMKTCEYVEDMKVDVQKVEIEQSTAFTKLSNETGIIRTAIKDITKVSSNEMKSINETNNLRTDNVDSIRQFDPAKQVKKSCEDAHEMKVDVQKEEREKSGEFT